MKRLAVIGVLLALLMAGCGEGDRTQKFARIAGERIDLPEDTPSNIFAVTRAILAETAYMPWYRNCIVSQAERILTPREARRFSDLSVPEQNRASFDIMMKASPHCEASDRRLVDPNAPPERLAPIRSQSALAMGLFVRHEGFTKEARRCVEERFRAASDGEIIELSNASEKVREERLLAIFGACA